MRLDFRKRIQASFVAFDCGDISALCEERAGQATGPRTHFDHGLLLQTAGLSGNLRCQVEVEKEVLAERLLRHQIMPLDHFAQWRKVVYAHAFPFAAFSASRRARRIAATRLSGRAMPLPAISKAVP